MELQLDAVPRSPTHPGGATHCPGALWREARRQREAERDVAHGLVNTLGAFADLIKADSEYYGKMAKTLNLKLD